MRAHHIILLVVAGALGGAVVTRVWQARQQPAAMVATVRQPVPAAPAVNPEPVAAPAANPEPVAVSPEPVAPPPDEPKPSPIRPVRHAKAAAPARPVRRVPPPAHPRPLELGQAIPPSFPPQATQQAPPQPAPAPEPVTVSPPPAPSPEPEPAPPSATPAPEPEPSHTVTLNAGMLIPVRLIDGLSSNRNQAGDTFTASLDHELVVDGWVIAERGARVEGRVVAADRGSKTKGNAALAIELTKIHTSDGQTVAVQTDSFERHAPTNHKTDAVKVIGGGILGAVIGGIAGGGEGAAIGAGAGAGAGTGDVLLTRKPATLPSETRITFRLRTPVTLTEKHE